MENQPSLRLIRILLRPIVKLCVKSGISIQELIEAAKNELVLEGAEQLERSSGTISGSRISIATGVSRREVSRILQRGELTTPVSNLMRRTLGQWEGDSRFTDEEGNARPLTYEGKKSEFWQLAKAVSSDVHPYSLMEEMERFGYLEKGDTHVEMRVPIAFLTDSPERVTDLLAKDLQSLIDSVSENVARKHDTKNLHLRTEYDNVANEDLSQIRSWLFEEGVKFHKRAREFLSQFDLDLNPNASRTGGAKVVLTAFSWTEREESKD